MRPIVDTLLRKWHRMLHLRRQSPLSWHQDRVREERVELRLARTYGERLSESSDVFFAIIRARYDGHPVCELPHFTTRRFALVCGYMLGKYTSRWLFYQVAAKLCGVPFGSVNEVVNASKDSKLAEVSRRHGIDEEKFQQVGRRLRRVWPLVP